MVTYLIGLLCKQGCSFNDLSVSFHSRVFTFWFVYTVVYIFLK